MSFTLEQLPRSNDWILRTSDPQLSSLISVLFPVTDSTTSDDMSTIVFKSTKDPYDKIIESYIKQKLPVWRIVTKEKYDETQRVWSITVNPEILSEIKHAKESIRLILESMPGLSIIDFSNNTFVVRSEVQPSISILSNWQIFVEIFKPRRLSEEELDAMFQKVPRVQGIGRDITQNARQEIIDFLKSQMRQVEVSPLALGDLIDEIVTKWYRAQIAPGSMVGITAAEAFSGPITQMALNSFSVSGTSKNVSYGIDALRGLMNVTTNIKHENSTIYFNKPHISFEEVFQKKKDIEELTVGSVLANETDTQQKYDIVSAASTETPWWVRLQSRMQGIEVPESKRILILYLNPFSLYINKLTTVKIATLIQKLDTYSIRVYASPQSVAQIWIYAEPQRVRTVLAERGYDANISEDMEGIFYTQIIVENLKKIYVSGIKGISKLFPSTTPVWRIIRDEISLGNGVYKLLINPIISKSSGLTADNIADACTTCKMEILEINHKYLIVKPTFASTNPLWTYPSLIPYHDVEFEEDQTDETWVAIGPEKDFDPVLEIVKSSLIDSNVSRGKFTIKFKPIIGASPGKIVRDAIAYQRAIYSQEGYNIRELENDPFFASLHQYYADANGANLKQLLSRKDVDSRRTIVNNIHQIYETLGIEASRNFLIKEFWNIITSEGSYINPKHVILIANFMTNLGQPFGITHTGLSRQGISTLTMASSERATEAFTNAAAFGKIDSVKNTTSAIATGQVAPIGTGTVDVLLQDEYKKLIESGGKISSQDLRQIVSQEPIPTAAAGPSSRPPIIKPVIKPTIKPVIRPLNVSQLRPSAATRPSIGLSVPPTQPAQTHAIASQIKPVTKKPDLLSEDIDEL